MVTIDNGADGVTEVAQQMPAIRDLDRVWGALAHAIGIRTGPVTCDDLDPGMLAKPHGQGLGLPIGQKVDHGVALEIDQGGAIPMVAPPGPVIDGEDARRGLRLVVVAGAPDQSQQRVRARRHGQPLAQAPASLAAEQPVPDGPAGCPVARFGVRQPGRHRTGARRRSGGNRPG